MALRSRLPLAFCLASALFAMNGCGGSKNTINSGTSETLPVTGGFTSYTANTTADIPPSTEALQTATINGKTVYIAPHSDTIPAGTPLAIIPANTPFFPTMTVGDSTRAVGTVTVKMDQGFTQVWPDGIADEGRIRADIAFYPGKYTVTISGPLNFNADNSKKLTVRSSLVFRFDSKNGKIGLPTTFYGSLPANGGNTRGEGLSLATEIPGTFRGGFATLTLFPSSNASPKLSKTVRTAYDGRTDTVPMAFTDNSGAGLTIPQNGLDRVLLDTRVSE